MELKRNSHSVDIDAMIQIQETSTLDYYDTYLGEAVEQKLMRGNFKLPILPVIATELIGKLSSSRESLDNITALVERDQSLAGYVLRFANSVMFAGYEPVGSLQEGIARVGLKVIVEFATILTFGDTIFKAKGLEPLMDRILRHAVLTAYLGREMASLLRKDADQQFMCGLLHTVGKPIVLQLVSEMELLIPTNPPHQGLIAMTDRLHQKAGTQACERWNLPEVVKVCCAHHHDCEKAPKFQDTVRITYLSSQIADRCLREEPVIEEALKQDPLFAVLGFDDDQVQRIFSMKDKIMENTETMFGSGAN